MATTESLGQSYCAEHDTWYPKGKTCYRCSIIKSVATPGAFATVNNPLPEPRFRDGNSVRIIAISLEGVVRRICFDGVRWTYDVSYWSNGDRCTEWLRDDEIEAC